jgi:multidrug resistance efflux pump
MLIGDFCSIVMPENSATSAKSTLEITSAQPLSLPLSEKWRIPKSHLKLGIGLTVLLAGAYGILSEQNYVSSSDAVVSAYVVVVRTPIDGIVQNLPASTNLHVREGQTLGHVENPRVDQQHLENLRVVEERTRSEADALAIEHTTLEQERRELLGRTHAHAKAVSDRIQHNILQNERLLLARQAAEKQAALDLDRGRKLRASGIIADADFDRLQTQYDIAIKEAQAQQAVVSAVHDEATSAAKGIYIEPGDNEVDYSRQRYDEVGLRLADIDRALAAQQIQANAAREDLDKETYHSELMTRADLTSPISGLLWKIDAVNGERVGTGDSLAEFVDCDKALSSSKFPKTGSPTSSWARKPVCASPAKSTNASAPSPPSPLIPAKTATANSPLFRRAILKVISP